jgi:hypothetical protein
LSADIHHAVAKTSTETLTQVAVLASCKNTPISIIDMVDATTELRPRAGIKLGNRLSFTTRSTSSKRRLLDLLARFFSSCSNIINSSVGAAASTFRGIPLAATAHDGKRQKRQRKNLFHHSKYNLPQ